MLCSVQEMAYASREARLLAVICWLVSGACLAEALKAWKKRYDPKIHGPVSAVRALITYWGPRFMKTGSIENKPRQKSPRKVSDAVAKKCAETIKQGYFQKRKCPGPQGDVVEVHLYWTSIKAACAQSPYLKQVCQTYGVSPAALLKRMREVDPKLKWKRLTYKNDLTDEQKQRRKEVAGVLLRNVSLIPDFLKRIFFIDECSIWLTASNVNVHVYADAHDRDVSAVMHMPGLKVGAKIKVKVFAVVNALMGPFFIDFTTGTTGLKRRHIQPAAPFMVSKGWYGALSQVMSTSSPEGFRVYVACCGV